MAAATANATGVPAFHDLRVVAELKHVLPKVRDTERTGTFHDLRVVAELKHLVLVHLDPVPRDLSTTSGSWPN